jgi:hypothetical protein
LIGVFIQGIYRFTQYAIGQTPPARVRYAHAVARLVTENDRQAVCSQHRTYLPGQKRYKGVAFYFRTMPATMLYNLRAMNLVEPLRVVR